MAVVGENADELGLRLAERYGLVSTSMDELMKGRKGRKTDNVKARAASEWLASRDASAGGERRPTALLMRECANDLLGTWYATLSRDLRARSAFLLGDAFMAQGRGI